MAAVRAVNVCAEVTTAAAPSVPADSLPLFPVLPGKCSQHYVGENCVLLMPAHQSKEEEL